jgi:hypothetical protein
MCFVEIDDFEHVFGEGDGSIGQNIFDGGNHIPYGLNLNRFYGQYIRFFVHGTQYMNGRMNVFIPFFERIIEIWLFFPNKMIHGF